MISFGGVSILFFPCKEHLLAPLAYQIGPHDPFEETKVYDVFVKKGQEFRNAYQKCVIA